MAARAAKKRKDRSDARTCEDLLRKLRKKQDELNTSIKCLRKSGNEGAVKAEEREKRFRTARTLLERPLDDLPRKRARIVQLSPDHLVRKIGIIDVKNKGWDN